MNCFKSGFLLPIILLAGCKIDVDVTGMLGASEPLTGSLTYYSDGGTIELYGGPHTHCVGSFTYGRASDRFMGSGMLVCDDRRTGPFTFVVKGMGMKHGSGSGTLNGQGYSFRF